MCVISHHSFVLLSTYDDCTYMENETYLRLVREKYSKQLREDNFIAREKKTPLVYFLLPKEGFLRTLQTWQVHNGAQIKSQIVPNVIQNVRGRKLSDAMEAPILFLYLDWYLNTPLLELISLVPPNKEQAQLLRQTNLLQTATDSISAKRKVEENSLSVSAKLCESVIAINNCFYGQYEFITSINYHWLGLVFVSCEDKKNAVAALEKSILIEEKLLREGGADVVDPNDLRESLKMAGSLLIDLGLFKEAEEKIRRVLELDKNNLIATAKAKNAAKTKQKAFVLLESLYTLGYLSQLRNNDQAALEYFLDAFKIKAKYYQSNMASPGVEGDGVCAFFFFGYSMFYTNGF